MRANKINQYQVVANDDKKEEFKEIRTLYIINNMLGIKSRSSPSKKYDSSDSEPTDDVELLLRELGDHNHDAEEQKRYFQETQENDYESLSNLRNKRIRESIESPMFGSKRDTFQSQRELVRGITITSKDELESAAPRKASNLMFKKQLRHFSFNESDNSSFPSSNNNSVRRQDSINSKNSHGSNRTSNFKPLQKQRQSNSSGKSGVYYKNPQGFKNHLKTIASLVGADKNVLPLPEESPVTKSATVRGKNGNVHKKRNTFCVPNMQEVIEVGNLQTSQSSSTSSHNSAQEPPSMKMIGAKVSTNSSGSRGESHFKIKITPEDRKPSASIERRPPNQGLVPPARREARRLSENPRNINLLHDVPRELKKVYRRRSSRSSRRNSKALLQKLINMK